MKRALINYALSGMRFIRPIFGPPGACIYTIDCQTYAEFKLCSSSLPVALACILVRVLGCNPLTYLILKVKRKITS